MKFSPRFLEEIQQRIQISQVIGAHVRLKKHGREYTGCCPFHHEKSPSFSVNDEKSVYHCFGCGAKGNVFQFLQDRQGLSFLEAVKFLAEKAGLPLPQEDNPHEQAQEALRHQIYQVLQEAAQWFTEQRQLPEAHAARHYLSMRQLSPETISRFQLGFAPTGNKLYKAFRDKGYTIDILAKAGLIGMRDDREPYDYFRNRLIFPIHDGRGRVIAFGGRVLDDSKPKYLNSPQTLVFNKSQVLYGLHLYRESLRKGLTTAKVVEGYTDVIALDQAGIQGGLAPLGTSLTATHIQEVWRYCPDPILCFDGDAAGYRAAERAVQLGVEILNPGYSLRFAHLPKGEDPDSLLRTGRRLALDVCLKSTVPLVDKLWDMYVKSHDISQPEKLAKVKADLMEMLKKIPSSEVRQLYQDNFRNRFFHLNRQLGRPKQEKAQGVSHHFDARRQQLYILFAIILNHPSILHDVEEPFSMIELNDLGLDELRENIFFAFHAQSDLDAVALQAQINKVMHGIVLSKILCEAVYLHASFARPGASLPEALQGWNEIYTLLMQNRGWQSVLSESQQNMGGDLTSQGWLRHKALIEQRLLNRTKFETD